MRLEEILSEISPVECRGEKGVEILSLTQDSRAVAPGSLFVAVKGFSSDGHAFIGKAVEAGAAAVIYDDPAAAIPEGVAAIRVENSRLALALAASTFYGKPSEKLTLVGITGTNGKTTTVTLLHEVFTGLGYSCGLLSTIANFVGSRRTETTNTTSDPLTINRLLAEMVAEGCEYCFMEVSSIGLEQDRVAGLHFKAAIFSNLTHDHLDYHKSFAEYLRCKKLFFDHLTPDAVAITNTDDRNGLVMLQNTAAKAVTYSVKGLADHTCRIVEESFDGMLLRIDGKEVWARLIGAHNAYNLLAVYTTAVELGAAPDEVLLAISGAGCVKGRLEVVRGPRNVSAVIDYAHTPDALENVLKTLRETARDKELICLFGCGGDRDRTKRPEMAAVAEKYADRIIVTSDNSRTEKTSDIIAEIRAGFSPKGLAKALFIEDRKEAIRTAIFTAKDGAAVLLAGKGHETYQITGTEKKHFDEREILAEIFKEAQI